MSDYEMGQEVEVYDEDAGTTAYGTIVGFSEDFIRVRVEYDVLVAPEEIVGLRRES